MKRHRSVADIGPAASDRHDVRRALQELPDGLRAAPILVGWFDMSGSVSRIRRSRRHPSAGVDVSRIRRSQTRC